MMEVGIVGIGNMGLGMALRLIDRGYAVGVRDLVAEREHRARAHGATVCADAAQAAQGRELLVVAVVDAVQTEQVLFGERGAVRGLARGSAVLLCPTLAPQTVEDCAARLAVHGIDCIDAPMSGGPARARDGTMSLMVACADAVFEHWQPLLRDLSTRLFRIGTTAGDGARTKLVNNLLAAINLAGAAEAVHAHMALLAKESGLALGMAAGAGLRPRLGPVAAALFADACASGLADQDDAALWRWLAQAGPLRD
jgi:putative dehydrogenase